MVAFKTVSSAARSVMIKLDNRGVLGSFGYKDVKKLSIAARRAALHRAAKQLGWAYIVRRLNVLYIFNKRRHPDTAALFRADRDYARAQ